MSRVLIVDDNDGIRLGVRLYLQGCGYEVVEASDCAAAARLFEERALDIAVLDYSLRDGNALDLLDRAAVLQPDMKVVVLTAYPSAKLAQDAFSRGAARFLIKPIELGELRMLIDALLSGASSGGG
jgi:DNA-binding NtrC family response regulator